MKLSVQLKSCPSKFPSSFPSLPPSTEANKEDGAKLFSVVSSGRTIYSENKKLKNKIKNKKFYLNPEHFCSVRVVKHWNRMSGGVAESPSLKLLQN